MTQAYKTMGEAYREMYAEFTDAHIGKLKKAYATLKGKRLSLDNNKKLTMIVNKMTKDQLVKVMNADIPFLSTSAMSTLVIKHKLKYPEIDKLRVKEEIGEEEETEEAYKLPRQLKNPKKETMVSKDKYGTIVIDKTDWPKYKAKGWELAEELELDEGKYSQYSSLLIQKGKLLGKGFIPTSMTVIRINKAIDKEMKKLGIVNVPSGPRKREELELDEGRMKDLHLYIQQKKSAEWIAKKMKLDVKTVKALMSSEFDPDKDKNKEKIKEAEDNKDDDPVVKAKDKADKDMKIALLKLKIKNLSQKEVVDLFLNPVDSETFLAEVRFADLRDKVKQATKYNDHFGARVYIAQQMKDREMESIYQALELAHRKYSRYIGNMAVKTRDKFEEIFKAKINAKWGRKLGKEIIDSL